MFLDGCNLPIGCRGVNLDDGGVVRVIGDGGVMTIPPEDFRLTSRARRGDGRSSSYVAAVNWVPIFLSALSPPRPALGGVTVVFDGAKYAGARKGGICGAGARFRLGPSSSSSSGTSDLGGGSGPTIEVEITGYGESADDFLVRAVSRGEDVWGREGAGAPDFVAARRPVSLDEAISILSEGDDADADALPYYVVIRRKAGGTKTHRRLFDKLHLRRPDEGALCLSSLTAGLRRSSLRIARELQREKSIERVIECERRDRDELRYVVITDDVYLTDRLVRGNGTLVLSYIQLTNMW
ncbi:hypothetical protein ACHAW5_007893 [Stephanodiscus triporus]|uniref:Uncharacterized protein n=1 Tax=Stephanodiscus triporus TaxID=2934178 RepID=A0ABD3P3Z3_9STRA